MDNYAWTVGQIILLTSQTAGWRNLTMMIILESKPHLCDRMFLSLCPLPCVSSHLAKLITLHLHLTLLQCHGTLHAVFKSSHSLCNVWCHSQITGRIDFGQEGVTACDFVMILSAVAYVHPLHYPSDNLTLSRIHVHSIQLM